MSSSQYQGELTMWRVCRWAIGYALRRWGSLAAVLASLVLFTVLEMLKPWPTVFLVDYVLSHKPMPPGVAAWVDRLPGGTDPLNLLVWSLSATVVIFLLSWAGRLAGEYPSITLGHRMNYDVANDLLAKLQRLSLQFHAKKSVGDSLSRINDCSCASVVVKNALVPTLWSFLTLLAVFCILFRLEPTLALLSLGVVPCMLYVLQQHAGPVKEYSIRQREAESQLYRVVEETFSSMPVVQAFGREEANCARFAQTAAESMKATEAVTVAQIRFNFLLGLITAIGTAGIFWLGAYRAQTGQLTTGAIIAFLSYLYLLYNPLKSIMSTRSTVDGAMAGAERVWEILRIEERIIDRPGAKPLTLTVGHIRLENVTFAYEPGRPVLHDISLDVAPEQTVALVGATGAGKSTLVGLLPRFFDPDQGRVLIDGQDLREVQVKSLRQKIGLVLQEPLLFPGSIADNIRFGNPSATFQEIEAAARTANADDFIMKLPKGYQTIIGERGATLSGGERQRLSIARALAKNAPILILDEPTSALDSETERELMQALERLSRGRTTFIIAHRLSTVRNADRIIVLDQGRIVEQGTHNELLTRGGIYSRCYELQSTPSGLLQPVAS
jgi:ATP-binding cassette subfamily B protein